MSAVAEPKDKYENDDAAYIASIDWPVYNILRIDVPKMLERLEWW